MGCKVFRVGVFFDGTGNNKFVDAKAGDGSASNVAKLYELYHEHEGEVMVKGYAKPLYTNRIYKEGIGTDKTRDDWHDDFWDRKSEKGAGGGGAKRIEEAVKEVKALLQAHKTGVSGSSYCERIIDVFGFSRGAAQARDFINTFHDFNNYFWKLDSVKIGFVGIYDTVGSFGLAGTEHNMKPKKADKNTESELSIGKFIKDQLTGSDEMGLKDHVDDSGFNPYNFNLAQGSADVIVHMVAASEARKNFPLSSLLSIGKHMEYGFLGVHSDIGGGYADEETEPHSYLLKTFSGDSSTLGRLLSGNQGKKNAEAYAIAENTKLKENGEAAKGWKIKIEKESFISKQPDKFHVYCYRKRKLDNGLSKVTLNLMHQQALLAGVPLKPIPNDENHSIPEDLQTYYEYCFDLRNITKWNSQEIRDFVKFSYPFTPEYFKNIDKKYRHHSAVDPAEAGSSYDGHTGFYNSLFQDSPDGSGGNDVRYVGKDANGNEVEINPRKNKSYQGELVAKRKIFENVQKKAIVPKSA